MEYQKQLEQRVIELEAQVDKLNEERDKWARDAFILKRLKKVIPKKMDEQRLELSSARKADHIVKYHTLNGQIAALTTVLNDIEHTEEDCMKYLIDELHSEGFFKF